MLLDFFGKFPTKLHKKMLFFKFLYVKKKSIFTKKKSLSLPHKLKKIYKKKYAFFQKKKVERRLTKKKVYQK